MAAVNERQNPLVTSTPRYSDLIHLRRYGIAYGHARGRLLDIACGVGYGAALLNSKGDIRYFGVDSDIPTVMSARREYGGFGGFAVINAYDCLPFATESFDTVCSLETIEHLEQAHQAGFYAELLRVLKRSGLLIISTPNRHWKTKQALRESGWSNPHHKYEFKTTEFEDFVLNAGTYPVHICAKYYLGFAYNLTGSIYPHVLTQWMHKRLPGKLLRMIDKVDIKLGALTPKHCNCLCFVMMKL